MSYWEEYWRKRSLSRRKFVAGAATAAVGGVALVGVGCGDDDDDDDDATTTATATSDGGTATAETSTATGTATGEATEEATATATEGGGDDAARYGGTFRASTLDPHRGSDPMINTLEPVFHTPRVYSWTHRYNVSADEIILDMATGLEQPDNETVIVTIRPDIQFHDVEPMNGRIVTAEDLAYTYNRFPAAVAAGSTINPVLYNWIDMAGLAASDEVTLTIPQTKPFAEVIQMMAQHHFAVIAQEADQAAGGSLQNTNTAGCGPYILTEADPSTKMVWTRNPNYFSHDHSDHFYFPANGGYPDAYEQYVIPDPSTTQAQLISGDLDQLYFNILNVDRILAEEFRSQGLQVLEGQANTNCTLVMAAPNFPDTRVRQALQKAIDYQGFIDTVYLGDGELGAPVGNGYTDAVRLPREEIAEYLNYNPEEAVALWEQAASEKTSFVMLGIANFPFMEAATGFVKQSIEAVLPVTIEIQAIDIPSWIARAVAAEKDWDFLVQFSQSTPDVPTFNILGTFDAGGQAAVGSNFKVDSPVPEIANLAEQSAGLSAAHYAENDPEARTPLLHDFQRFALENAVPGIPLPVRKIDWLVASARVMQIPVENPNFFRSMLLDNMYLDPTSP